MSMTISTSDATIVRTVIEDWAAAVRRRDFAGILRDHDLQMLHFDVPPPLQSTGLEAYKRSWDAFFAWTHDPVVFEVTNVNVTAGSDVAFATATIRCAGESNGRASEEHVRLTVGLRKVGDRWTILHEHHSVAAE